MDVLEVPPEHGSAPIIPKSVDEVHDLLDSLVLSVFNTVRGHGEVSGDGSNLQAVQQANSEVIRETLESTLTAIDNLVGINSTQVQQEQILSAQSEQIASLKAHILQLEEQMRARKSEIDGQLNTVLSNSALGLG